MAERGKETSVYKDFVRLLRMNARRLPVYFTGMLFMTVCTSLLGILGANVSRFLVEAIEAENYLALRSTVIYGFAGLVALGGAFPFFMYMYNCQAKWITADIRAEMMLHRSKLPVTYFENNHSSELISRLFHDANQTSTVFGSKIRRFLAPIVTSVVYFTAMLQMEWRISLILLAVNLVCFFINFRFSKPFRAAGSEISKASPRVVEKFMNIVSGALSIRVFSASRHAESDFSAANDELTKKGVRYGNIYALLESVNFFFGLITGLAFIVVASVFVTRGLTTFGALIGLVSLQRLFGSSLLQIGYNGAELSGGMASVRRLFEFFDTPAEAEFFPEMGNSGGAYIEFRDVSFSYDSSKRVLDGFSMKIGCGEKAALVGPSGSGKSTVSKLMMGFYRPELGEIIIGGETFASRNLRDTREMIAYVAQEPYLYNISIKDNIRCGRLDATDEDIIEAAKAANAHEFIMQLSSGYDTIAGERGAQLSGGQRQRIAIARAFLKNAPILILDEATSALDSESERFIQDAMDRLLEDRTALIIAHRPSTIASADKVIRLQGGSLK